MNLNLNSRTNRKVTAAALVAVALVGLRTASAAGADLDPRELFVGGGTAEQCGSSAITIDYDVAYDATLRGYGVSATQLSGLDVRCLGYELIVTLSGPGGSPLAEMTAVVDGEQMRVVVPVSTPVAVEDLNGVSVVLLSEAD